MALTTGTRLGPYAILSALGAGGMGEVYRARDTKLNRDVALKVIPDTFALDPDRVARFTREAQVLASLNHPHIAAIYGFEDSGETHALVLELVEGETLADRIRRGPMPLAPALTIARQIAEALDAAHERGIVHRDLKPANIKITTDDVVKVLDFGLAKAFASDLDGAPDGMSNSPTIALGATGTGVILGTAAYMSPEQARGRAVDKRTDIWAFGCVLYEMLTGTQAFNGESISDTIVAILEREPDLSRLPASTAPNIRRLLRRSLQKDVKRRLRDIADAQVEIDEAIALPALPGMTEPQGSGGQRRPSSQMLPLLVIGLLAAMAIGWFVGRPRETVPVPAFDRVIRLVSTAAHEFGPIISPDGKWVAYFSNAIKFVRSTGQPAHDRSEVPERQTFGNGFVSWSPDGTRVAAVSLPGAASGSIWIVEPTAKIPFRKLLDLPAGVFLRGATWSRDGSSLIVGRIQSSGDIFFAERSVKR